MARKEALLYFLTRRLDLSCSPMNELQNAPAFPGYWLRRWRRERAYLIGRVRLSGGTMSRGIELSLSSNLARGRKDAIYV